MAIKTVQLAKGRDRRLTMADTSAQGRHFTFITGEDAGEVTRDVES